MIFPNDKNTPLIDDETRRLTELVAGFRLMYFFSVTKNLHAQYFSPNSIHPFNADTCRLTFCLHLV